MEPYMPLTSLWWYQLLRLNQVKPSFFVMTAPSPRTATLSSRCDHFFLTKRIDTNVYLVECSTWSFLHVPIRKYSHCVEIFKIIVGYLAVIKRKFGEFAQRPLKGSPPVLWPELFGALFALWPKRQQWRPVEDVYTRNSKQVAHFIDFHSMTSANLLFYLETSDNNCKKMSFLLRKTDIIAEFSIKRSNFAIKVIRIMDSSGVTISVNFAQQDKLWKQTEILT